MTQGLTLLGATGSIGASTLDVIARHPDRYSVFAVTAHRAAEDLLLLCRRHAPRYAVLSGLPEDEGLRRRFAEAGKGTQLLFGDAALGQVAADPDCAILVAAIVGAAGLAPILAGARAGKRLLLANKESLVMAGALFMRTVRENGATLLPIDSEHNAIFQCLPQVAGRASTVAVRRILLTASGGPFRSAPIERLSQVTPEQACAHPNWVMGRKISVDSATMMNKGLEVIEARWLFDVPPERIEVLVHSQSIIHSLVEFVDGSVMAQLSNPDMRVPIAHALAFPERIQSGAVPLDLAALGQLSFERPDAQRFPCLELAYAALREGGTAPAVLNAANEVAVSAFLEGKLRYTAIPQVIERSLRQAPAMQADSVDTVLEADRNARRIALDCAAALMGKAA
jgi:1-deoxy-D-xylulose-5-phosphate reductoisomerase